MSMRRRPLDDEASRVTGNLGKMIRRLRAASNFSLSDLSEQSGVAKSIISQIETNDTNPTLSTLRKLARALNAPIEAMLCRGGEPALVERVASVSRGENAAQGSGGCVTDLSWGRTSDVVRWRHIAIEPGCAIEAEAHPAGVVENLTVIEGVLSVTMGEDGFALAAGETARYHASSAHRIANDGRITASALQVSLLKLARRQVLREGAATPRDHAS